MASVFIHKSLTGAWKIKNIVQSRNIVLHRHDTETDVNLILELEEDARDYSPLMDSSRYSLSWRTVPNLFNISSLSPISRSDLVECRLSTSKPCSDRRWAQYLQSNDQKIPSPEASKIPYNLEVPDFWHRFRFMSERAFPMELSCKSSFAQYSSPHRSTVTKAMN